jgi:hypothetical protein
MYQRDRPVVPDFDGAEGLYLRYGRDDFADGHLLLASIRFPRTSVNRASLSLPEDALFDENGKYNGLGVVEFKAYDLPPRINQSQGPAYVFFMQHVPLPANYSHSEIWSDQEARTGAYREPSRTVKLEFRIRLCQRISRDCIRVEAVRNRLS